MQIFREYDSVQELEEEFDTNFRKARAFVKGSFLASERQACELVLIHPESGEWFPLPAEVVHIAPEGIGLQLVDWGPVRIEALERFVEAEPSDLQLDPAGRGTSASPHSSSAGSSSPVSSLPPSSSSPKSSPPSSSRYSVITPRTPRSNRPPSERASDVSAGQDDDEDLVLVPSSRPPGSRQSGEWTEEGPNSGGPESESPHSEPPPKNVQERVRKLNARERDHLARQGTLTERVALERAYGSVVWEALLSNPALTGPEIARIAKNGTITQPHLKIIVHNASWLSKGEVRRALLSNPRLTVPHAERVLRALPPAELRQLPTQTAYPPQVRALARKMLPKTS